MTMRKFLLAALMALLLLPAMSSGVRAEPFGRPVIAVLPFTKNSTQLEGMSYYDAMTMSSFLTKELKNTQKFRVVEIGRVADIVNIQAYNAGLLTSPLVQMNAGNLLQAQYVIIGEILGEGTKVSGINYENSKSVRAGGNKYKVETMVSVRMVDVNTGEVLYISIGRGASSATNAEFSLTERSKSSTETIDYDEDGNPIMNNYEVIEPTTHNITIGSNQINSVQFLNAVTKAITDAVFDKKEGMLAEINGTNTRGK